MQVTLPSGVERTAAVRSGPSGSATGTFGAEWQCGSHCHSLVNVQGWSVQCRVAVRPVRSGSSGSATGTPGYARARVAVRQARPGTLRPEWQCRSHCQVASSVPLRYAQGRVAVRPVRSGPSGSATGTFGVEWQCGSHCHSLVNVQGLSVQCRVAVRPVCSGVVWPRMSGSALDLSRGWPFMRGISWQAGRFLNELVKLVCSALPTCNGYGSRRRGPTLGGRVRRKAKVTVGARFVSCISWPCSILYLLIN